MTDYKEKFERWQKKATEKLEEIDAQLGLKDKIEGGARVVYDTAQKGADRIKTEAEKTDVGKQAVKVASDVINTADDTAKTAWNVSEPIRDAAGDAGKTAGGVVVDAAGKAGDMIDDARETVTTNAKRVAKWWVSVPAYLRLSISLADLCKRRPIGSRPIRSVPLPPEFRWRSAPGSESFSPASAHIGSSIPRSRPGRSRSSAKNLTVI